MTAGGTPPDGQRVPPPCTPAPGARRMMRPRGVVHLAGSATQSWRPGPKGLIRNGF